jgi:hypothetical protein
MHSPAVGFCKGTARRAPISLTINLLNFRRDFHAVFLFKLNGRGVIARKGDCPQSLRRAAFVCLSQAFLGAHLFAEIHKYTSFSRYGKPKWRKAEAISFANAEPFDNSMLRLYTLLREKNVLRPWMPSWAYSRNSLSLNGFPPSRE